MPSPDSRAWLEGGKHSRLANQAGSGIDQKVLAALYAQERDLEDIFENGAIEVVYLLYRPEGLS